MKGKLQGRGARFEVSTNTRDPSLQLVFADPSPGSLTQLGLSIPSAVPSAYAQTWANRYLALLVSVKFAAGDVARLVGMRQRVLIGQSTGDGEGGNRGNVYTAQTTPDWHFTDGNISWHLRRVPLGGVYAFSKFNAAELAFRTSDTPAILFENAPAQANGYAPPNGGMPPGNVLIPEFGTFHDVRFPWVADHAWSSLDCEIRGPCAINFYASIRQTNPSTRPVTAPGATTTQIPLLPPEDQWVLQWTDSIYTRIAGSLIFEVPAQYAVPKALRACDDGAVTPRPRRPSEPRPPSAPSQPSGPTPRSST